MNTSVESPSVCRTISIIVRKIRMLSKWRLWKQITRDAYVDFILILLLNRCLWSACRKHILSRAYMRTFGRLGFHPSWIAEHNTKVIQGIFRDMVKLNYVVEARASKGPSFYCGRNISDQLTILYKLYVTSLSSLFLLIPAPGFWGLWFVDIFWCVYLYFSFCVLYLYAKYALRRMEINKEHT